MPESTKVDELYMELTLAMDSLDSDFALADEKIKNYTAKMRREQNINKIKMDIELNGFDDASKNEEALAAKMKHLNSIINDQKKIIEATKMAYDQSVKAKGADYYQSKRLEDSILRQQKELSKLEQSYRETAKQKEILNKSNGSNANNTPISNIPKESEGIMGSVLGIVKGGWAQVASILATTISFKWFTDINSEMENFKLQIDVMLKDAEKSKNAMAEFKEYADKTPFTTPDVVNAGKSLISAQIDDYQKFLKLSGDWAAATGKNITEVTSVFARVQSAQFGEAVERMRELNISSTDLLAQGIRMSKNNEVLSTADEMMTALENIINTRFGGMTEKMGNSWSGIASTFESSLEDVGRELSSGIFEELKTMFADINNEISALVKSGELKNFGNIFGEAIKQVVLFVVNLLKMTPIITVLKALFNGLEVVLAGVAVSFSLINYALETTVALLTWVLDLMRNGLIKANENFRNKFNEINKKNNDSLRKMGMSLMGVKEDTEELTEATEKYGNKAQAENEKAIKSAIKSRQAKEIEIETLKKIEDADISLAKARQENSVSIAQKEHANSIKRLALLEKEEEAVKKLMLASGKKYTPSDKYLDAMKDEAEKLTALYEAKVKQSDAMGEFVYSSQKLNQEAKNTIEMGGDATVKYYETIKGAINDYLADLDKLRQSQIDCWIGSQQAMLSYSSVVKDNVISTGYAFGNSSSYIINKTEEMKFSIGSLENKLVGLNSQEKMANTLRLKERLDVIRNMLNAENLGAQQRKQLIENERSVFSQYTKSIGDGIKNAMTQIESLQNKVISSANATIDILSKRFPNMAKQGMREIAEDAKKAWESTSQHTTEQINTMLALKDKFSENGVNLGVNISYKEVMQAYKNSIDGVQDSIKTLKDNMLNLVDQAKVIGNQAGNVFFSEWSGYLSELQNSLSNKLDMSNAGIIAAKQFFEPWQEQADKISLNIGNAIANNNAIGGNATINLNSNSNVEFKGFTTEEINNAIEKAKDTFGNELRQAFDDAKAQYSI